MTTNELRKHFNDTFGMGRWPKTFEVTAETYGNVCHDIIKHHAESDGLFWDVVENGKQKPAIKTVLLIIGDNRGIMFKDVELILKERE